MVFVAVLSAYLCKKIVYIVLCLVEVLCVVGVCVIGVESLSKLINDVMLKVDVEITSNGALEFSFGIIAFNARWYFVEYKLKKGLGGMMVKLNWEVSYECFMSGEYVEMIVFMM